MQNNLVQENIYATSDFKLKTTPIKTIYDEISGSSISIESMSTQNAAHSVNKILILKSSNLKK